MKRTAISLTFIILIVFSIDRIGSTAMWWVNQHTRDISGPKIKYLVNDVHEDVILMGTSRCNLHYVPSIIEDSIGMSVYNGGIDASGNIFAHYIMLCHILAHHTPKVICLDVMTSDFAKEKDPFRTISFFAPYFGQNEMADSVFRDAGRYWPYHISHLYRYNAKAASNLAGLVVNKQAHGENGYLPHAQPQHEPELLTDKEWTEIDSMKVQYIHRFITECQQRSIKLVFMVSPAYTISSQRKYSVLKQIAKENCIPMLDYHTAGLYLNHPDYFKDNTHLWDKGARLYSSVFASDMKRILQDTLLK